LVISPIVENHLLISYLPITKCSASSEAQLKVDHADSRIMILLQLNWISARQDSCIPHIPPH